jgi:hypothetical protein
LAIEHQATRFNPGLFVFEEVDWDWYGQE